MRRRMRPTVASLNACSGQRPASASAIRAFPAHGISRRSRSTRRASVLVHRGPRRVRGRLLRGTKAFTPPFRSRLLHSQ